MPYLPGSGYTERFRFGRLSLTMMAVGVVGGVGALAVNLPGGASAPLAGGFFAVTGTLAALYGPLVWRRVPGLRVDRDGILFGGRPPIQGRTSRFVPWSRITEIYLFRVRRGLLTSTYVGLRGPAGVKPVDHVLPTMLARTIVHVPLEVVLASRPAYGWRLDPVAFAAAVGEFAPAVPVVDVTAVAVTPQPLLP